MKMTPSHASNTEQRQILWSHYQSIFSTALGATDWPPLWFTCRTPKLDFSSCLSAATVVWYHYSSSLPVSSKTSDTESMDMTRTERVRNRPQAFYLLMFQVELDGWRSPECPAWKPLTAVRKDALSCFIGPAPLHYSFPRHCYNIWPAAGKMPINGHDYPLPVGGASPGFWVPSGQFG